MVCCCVSYDDAVLITADDCWRCLSHVLLLVLHVVANVSLTVALLVDFEGNRMVLTLNVNTMMLTFFKALVALAQ